MYFFILINFTKSCRLLATFFKTNKTFQHCLNIVVKVIWLCDVGQCWNKFETTLCMYTLKFTTLNNVKLTLSVSKLILTTLDNAETMLLVWTSSLQRRKNALFMIIFIKLKRAKLYFRASKKRWLILLTTLAFDWDRLKRKVNMERTI